jgi:CRP/FNR family cyclic AMP-dependent transcriptional regulator
MIDKTRWASDAATAYGEEGRAVAPEDVPLFAGVPPDRLHAAIVIRDFTAGTLIFRQDDPTSGLWVILSGRVAVERLGPDGGVYTTGVWQPGELIGIAGLWDGSGYPASARALDNPTTLLWMDRGRFLTLHRQIPAFAEAVSRALASRLRYIQETVADTRGRPTAVQLALILATLCDRTGPDIALTHEDLAHMLGAKRETVTRCLTEFRHQGWVDSHYGHLTVRDSDALRRLATEGLA